MRVFSQAMSGQLASHNTYANIVHNKANIDYCIEQFSFVESRIKCIKLMTGNVRPLFPPVCPQSRWTHLLLGPVSRTDMSGLQSWCAQTEFEIIRSICPGAAVGIGRVVGWGRILRHQSRAGVDVAFECALLAGPIPRLSLDIAANVYLPGKSELLGRGVERSLLDAPFGGAGSAKFGVFI